MNKTFLSGLLACLILSAAGCSSDAGSGDLSVVIYGEAFIESGIPADEVSDGWAITFDKYLVTVHAVQVGSHDGDIGASLAGPVIYDLTQSSNGAGHAVVSASGVPAIAYDSTSYRIGPATAGATAGNASADDVTAMTQGGYSVWMSGSATRNGETRTFAWGFTTDTHYQRCHSTASVPDGGSATTQLTIHADHSFYDSLVSEEPALRFQPFADADTDADGAITQAELEAADIGDLDPGNQPINTLWPYLEAQSATLGHIDGEGHCDVE